MAGYKASRYTSSSSSRNSPASTRPVNRYDGLESLCCIGSNLPQHASLRYETLSHQWQDATLIEKISKRLIHVRAYRSTLPIKKFPLLLLTGLPKALVFRNRSNTWPLNWPLIHLSAMIRLGGDTPILEVGFVYLVD